jgi:hypothetical protein
LNRLKLDGCEFPQAALSAAPVVPGFDPGHDRESEFVAAGSALPVEDVLLEQGEERFHGGVVAAGSDPTHRAAQLMDFKDPDVPLGPELTAAIAVNDEPGSRRAQRDRVPQC